jgi:hypothetical protein
MTISTIQVSLNRLRSLNATDKRLVVDQLRDVRDIYANKAYNDAFDALIELVEDERTLGRYPYSNEATRSEAMSNARRDAEARRSNGEKVQWRHIDDDTGVAYVVERLG